MEHFLVVVVGLTSVGACVIGRNWLSLSWNNLRLALNVMLESVGVGLVFFAVNLAAGIVMILVGRLLLREFVTIYLVSDSTLLVLSLLQGLVFQWWLRGHGSPARRRARGWSHRDHFSPEGGG